MSGGLTHTAHSVLYVTAGKEGERSQECTAHSFSWWAPGYTLVDLCMKYVFKFINNILNIVQYRLDECHLNVH